MGLILYFLRHGETQASQTGGYCGVSDAALTPEGRTHPFCSVGKDSSSASPSGDR
jgi:bisphosphoglycerate-dependent phosphoglycerate mutase